MSLIKNGLVLTFARFTNYVMMLVTPLFLVRMVDVTTYGQYREFLLYATILAALFGLAIKDNLIYTIPRDRAKAAAATTQTVAMLLTTTTVGLTLFVVGSPWFMRGASFDFLWLLVLYVFLVLNFDVLESYWLAMQQPARVLYYTSTRTFIRIVVVVAATYYLRNLHSILLAIIIFEAIKAGVCIALLLRLHALVARIDRELLSAQLKFIVPLSAAGLLYFINQKIGYLYISTAMGATALAIYTVGTYQLPITAIVRSAVADTLFPEMVRHAAAGSMQGVELWKKATLLYCLIVFPVFAILFVYAEQFVVTLFTDAYREATNVFRVALVVMIRQCFEMGTPLRAANNNRQLLIGNLFAVVLHLPLLFLLSRSIGIMGAAIAWLIADLTIACYLATRIMRQYQLGIEVLAHWPRIGKLALATIVSSPILFIGIHFVGHGLWVPLLASAAFFVAYLVSLKVLAVSEFDDLVGKLTPLIVGRLGKR